MIKQIAGWVAGLGIVAAGVALTTAGSPEINAKPPTVAAPTKETPKGPKTSQRPTQPRAATAEQFATLAMKQQQGYHGRPNIYSRWYAQQTYAKHYAAHYGGYSAKAYTTAPWCVMFVDYVAAKANIPKGQNDALAAGMAREFRDVGRLKSSPSIGSLAFFDFSGNETIGGISHVGVVVGWTDSKVRVVEGNVSNNRVRISWRPRSQVTGYGLYKFSK